MNDNHGDAHVPCRKAEECMSPKSLVMSYSESVTGLRGDTTFKHKQSSHDEMLALEND